jgi:hypothetical protein
MTLREMKIPESDDNGGRFSRKTGFFEYLSYFDIFFSPKAFVGVNGACVTILTRVSILLGVTILQCVCTDVSAWRRTSVVNYRVVRMIMGKKKLRSLSIEGLIFFIFVLSTLCDVVVGLFLIKNHFWR